MKAMTQCCEAEKRLNTVDERCDQVIQATVNLGWASHWNYADHAMIHSFYFKLPAAGCQRPDGKGSSGQFFVTHMKPCSDPERKRI